MSAPPRTETEQELIQRAQTAVSGCNWEVGECAAQWTKRFARGRTDQDFALLVGLSGDQVYQRRRVWETFGDVFANYSGLRWSHFYTALNWDDAAECLQWANDIGATVAEMKAWRRAQRGEDLTETADEVVVDWIPGDTVPVRLPGEGGGTGESRSGASTAEAVPFLGGVPRQSDQGEDYAPFHDGAIVPPTAGSAKERPAPSFDQIARKLAGTLERCLATVTADEFVSQFADLEESEQKKLKSVLQKLGQAGQRLG
jgi:hypothetical protein